MSIFFFLFKVTTTGLYNCTNCSKTFKTIGGLTRHSNRLHNSGTFASEKIKGKSKQQTLTLLTEVNLKELVKKTQYFFKNNKCYPTEMMQELSSYQFVSSPQLLEQLNVIGSSYMKAKDTDDFFETYYATIVMCAKDYFDIEPPLCTLLATKLCETLLTHLKGPPEEKVLKASVITDRELDSLQYLSGYVVRKIIKKAKNSTNYASFSNQTIIKVLSTVIAESYEDQKLVNLQSRGGLTGVITEIQQIFIRTEEMFREITETKSHVDRINIQEISEKLQTDEFIISIYGGILLMSNLDELCLETAENLLDTMIVLYLRVRSFSFVKDKVSEKKSQSKKKKALRKDLKRKKEIKDQQIPE